MNGNGPKRYVLDGCDHVIVFTNAPSRGEFLWCVRCEEYRRCLGRDLREWAAKCSNCATTSWHGQSRDDANLAAHKHAMRRPSHSPFVTYAAPRKESMMADSHGEDVAYG